MMQTSVKTVGELRLDLPNLFLPRNGSTKAEHTDREREREREGRRKGQRWGPGPRVANLEQVQQLTQILVASERH